MKNVVKINLDNNCNCDCLYSLGGSENSVNLELQHDSYVNPILALISDTGTVSIKDFELVGDSLIKYQISQKYWNVDGQISLTVSDGDWISDPITFQCKAMKDCDNIRVKKLDDNYTIYGMLKTLNEGSAFGSTETQIGTYDGKPVYRKVIKTVMTNWATTTNFTAINVAHGISNFGIALNVSSYVARSDRRYKIPYYNENGVLNTFFMYADNTNVVYRNKTAWGSAYTLYTIIDYTKATD